MTNLTKTYFELIELIEQQGQVIKKQNDTIEQLIKDNLEKENLVNELLN